MGGWADTLGNLISRDNENDNDNAREYCDVNLTGGLCHEERS